MATTKRILKKNFDLIRLSLSGEEQDYTEGSIRRAVVLLAIPMILELSLESVFALVDLYFVGHLGEKATATVGLTESFMTIIYSLGMGISMGATAIIARRIGEKDQEAASRSAAQAIVLGLILTCIITVAGVFGAPHILQMMGADEEVIQEGTGFTRIMFAGSYSIMFLFLINGIFRGAGNAAIAMKSLWIASLINIILCPIMINAFGLEGAAMATVIGRTTGVLYQLRQLFRGNGSLLLFGRLFKWDGTLIRSIIKLSWPATFQFIIASGSWIILSHIVAETGGTTASAGYQIAVRNVIFFILPAWGLSNAAATLVGQNLGAQKPDRAKASVRIAALFNATFMAVVMLIFFLFGETIVSQFSQNPDVIRYAELSLKFFASGYIFFGVGMVFTQALNGAGDTKTPTWINFFCFWIFQVPFAYFMAYNLEWNAAGAFIAVPVAETMIALIAWYFFIKGKWKTIHV